MDKLHGILMTYEMRTEKEKPSKKEAGFKSSKRTKNGEHKSSKSSTDESIEEEANFIRKLKKGPRKYKQKLPFKCFKFDNIGHFVAKCPYPIEEESDDEKDHNHKANKNKYKKSKSGNKKIFYKKKKSLYSKENSSSSDERNDDEI